MITSSTVFDIKRFGAWVPSHSPPLKPKSHDKRFSWQRANSVDSVDQSSPGDSGCLPYKNGGNQFPRAAARETACTRGESFSPLWNLVPKGIGRTEMSLTVAAVFLVALCAVIVIWIKRTRDRNVVEQHSITPDELHTLLASSLRQNGFLPKKYSRTPRLSRKRRIRLRIVLAQATNPVEPLFTGP